MRLEVFWATLLRRWYFVVAAVAATMAVTLLVVAKVGPTYSATGAVLVLPPVTTLEQGAASDSKGNPYLMLGGLSQVRDIVVRRLTSQTTLEELCQQSGDPAYLTMQEAMCKSGPSVTYEVTPDFTNSAPLILVTVEADTAANAVVALGAVMNRVPVALEDLQAGLKLRSTATITSKPLIADRVPKAGHKDQIRAGIAAGAGTLALGLLMVGLLDGLLAARRTRAGARRAGRQAPEDEQAPDVIAHLPSPAAPLIERRRPLAARS